MERFKKKTSLKVLRPTITHSLIIPPSPPTRTGPLERSHVSVALTSEYAIAPPDSRVSEARKDATDLAESLGVAGRGVKYRFELIEKKRLEGGGVN